MNRHYPLSAYFRQLFGQRISKVPLDAGATCPNRDGKLSTDGCIFCNEKGSGTGLSEKGLNLLEQWNNWRERGGKKFDNTPAMAYLQSFTNTYCSTERLKELVTNLASLPDLAGICLGTRPDCLDEERIEILAASGVEEFWLDLGLQSSNDETLTRINRGHDAETFAKAVHLADAHGLKVCAHIIAGLPGETVDDFVASAEFVSSLPIAGIKLHNLYVCKGAPLYSEFTRNSYQPMSRDEYVQAVTTALTRIRPNIVVHRLASDPAQGELVAPDWARNKLETLNAINRALNENGWWQGKSTTNDIPDWFDASNQPPASLTQSL